MGFRGGSSKFLKKKISRFRVQLAYIKHNLDFFFLKQFESVMIQVKKTSSNRFHEVQSLLRNTNSLASIKKHCRSGLCILSGKGKKTPSMERLQHVDV